MDAPVKNKLERWIRQQVYVQDEERGSCLRLILRHVAGGRVGSDLLSVKVPRKLDDAWISQIVNDIEMRVMDDTEGLGGVQTYVLHSFHQERSDKPSSRFTIRETSAEENLDDVESEPPTKTGILSQMMRHTEAAHRVSLMATGQIINTLRQTNARQSELIEKLMSEKMDGLATLERLRSEETERRILLQRAEQDEKFRGEMFEKVSLLLPVIANRIAGKPLLPAKKGSAEAMLQSFAESLSVEQVESLQASLRPEQMLALMEILQSLQPVSKSGNGAAQSKGE